MPFSSVSRTGGSEASSHTNHPAPGNHRAEVGQPRVIPIAYFFHEGKYLIVESNWGKDKHADWYLNLKKNRARH